MGWNKLNRIVGKCKYIKNDDLLVESFYFVHNYAASKTVGLDFYLTTNYCSTHPIAMCGKERTIGFQFHPERSGEAGLKLLEEIIINLKE